jgi:hypothetical protein
MSEPSCPFRSKAQWDTKCSKCCALWIKDHGCAFKVMAMLFLARG